MKKITVIVRALPLNTLKNSEALRMSVGLTLKDDKVTILFIDDGVYTATLLKPEFINSKSLKQEFDAFAMLKCPLLADIPSLEKRGIKNLVKDVKPTSRDEIVKIITESDIVIPF